MKKGGPEFGVKVLRYRVDVFSKKVFRLVSDITDETIHETRVESRRMRAALEAFQERFPPRPFESAYRAVRRITNILGRPRETAVSLGLIRELAGSGEAEPFCLEYLDRRFAARLGKQEKRLHKELRRIDPLRLRSRLEFLLSIMEPASALLRKHSDRQVSHPVQPTLFPMNESATEQAYRILTGLTKAIFEFRTTQRFNTASDTELHALRIAAKKSRYAMEIYTSIWPGGLADRIEKARRLQVAGGTHNDWSVLRLRFEDEIKRLDSPSSVALAFQIGRLAAYAEQRKTGIRATMRTALIEFQESLAGLSYTGKLLATSKLETTPMVPSLPPLKRQSKPRKAVSGAA
jgi:CHAD domain-containing protein